MNFVKLDFTVTRGVQAYPDYLQCMDHWSEKNHYLRLKTKLLIKFLLYTVYFHFPIKKT